MLLLQRNFTTGHCDIISSHHFDFYIKMEAAKHLKNLLIRQRAGTVIAVITGDETTGIDKPNFHGTIPGTHIDVVKPVLRDMGVELRGKLYEHVPTYTVFRRMSALELIISAIDVPRISFDSRRSNETHYVEGKRS